jgi:hypothetical protein
VGIWVGFGPKFEVQTGCLKRDTESLGLITVWKFLNRQILLLSKEELKIINLVVTVKFKNKCPKSISNLSVSLLQILL